MKRPVLAVAGACFSLLLLICATAYADDGVRARSRALCASVSSADVAQAIGGKPGAGDVVMDDPETGSSCVFVDESNYYNGLSLEFHTTADLTASGGRWDTAAEYFEEFTRKGRPVPGVGDAAAWVEDMFVALFALRGDTVVRMTSGNKSFEDPAARARFEALMAKVVAGLP